MGETHRENVANVSIEKLAAHNHNQDQNTQNRKEEQGGGGHMIMIQRLRSESGGYKLLLSIVHVYIRVRPLVHSSIISPPTVSIRVKFLGL